MSIALTTSLDYSRIGSALTTQFSSVQPLSHVRLFATPWTIARQASLSITNSQSPPKPGLLSQWCHPTILSSVIPFSYPQSFPASGLFQGVGSLIRCPKYWCFSFSISPSSGYSGLISFRIDWFDLLAIQGTLKSLLQHHSFKSIHQFFDTQPSLWSYSHIHIWLLEKP